MPAIPKDQASHYRKKGKKPVYKAFEQAPNNTTIQTTQEGEGF
jgi:hypothetical protein